MRRAPYRETVTLLAEALKLDADERARLEAAAEGARTRGARTLAIEPQLEASAPLPIQLTALIGREQDVVNILEMLGTSRLVTITGSGGVGKTRVAIEVAARIPADRRSEVRFVDLSQLSDGALAAETVAARLDLTGDATTSIAGLVRALQERRVIIVLDNCEHIIADVALLVSSILKSCPGVTLLAASRERLAVSGELVYRLPSLDLPLGMPLTLDEALTSAGIQLFVQRARAIDHTVGFTDADVDAIAEICRRLGGIPLAIELAAARVASLGVDALRLRLRDGLALAGSLRSLQARQQTMQATIAWSYDLLSDDERRVLHGISLFAGGFTLSAAESVCGAGPIAGDAVVDILSALVDKSLVNVGRSEALQRFSLLDSVRSFAREQLQKADQVAFFSERHAEWMATFADWVNDSRAAFPDHRLRTEVDPELENARAALTWALGQNSEAGAVLAGRIVGGMRAIWLTSGRRSECHRWMTSVLAIIDERRYPKVVAPMLRALVQMASGAELFALAEQAMVVFEQIEDRMGVALLHSHVGRARRLTGLLDEADMAIEKAGAIFASSNLPHLMPYVTFLQNRFELRLDQGRYSEARADLDEAVAVLKSLGDDEALRWQAFRSMLAFITGETAVAISILEDVIARALKRPSIYVGSVAGWHADLTILYIFAGDADRAYVAAREALRWLTTYSHQDASAKVLLGIALLAAARGQAHRAARLIAALDSLVAQPHFGISTTAMDAGSRRARQLLGEMLDSAFAPNERSRLDAEGRALSENAAIAEALKV